MTTIPLRAFPLVPRKPELRAEGGVLTFRLPGWFGSTTFSTPLSNVAVAALDAAEDMGPDVVLAEPLVIPYVYTSSATKPPNIGLAFAEPVALPAFRLLVRQQANELAPKRPAREGRPAGRYVDGMVLRAVDPAAAVAALAEAGAVPVSNPTAWLVERRELVTDPVLAADIERREERSVRWENALFAVGAAGFATLVAGGAWLGDGVMAAGGVTMLAALGAQQVLAWRAERRAFSPPDAGPPRPPGGGPAG